MCIFDCYSEFPTWYNIVAILMEVNSCMSSAFISYHNYVVSYQQVCVPGIGVCLPGNGVWVLGIDVWVPRSSVCFPGSDVCVPGNDVWVPGSDVWVPGNDVGATCIIKRKSAHHFVPLASMIQQHVGLCITVALVPDSLKYPGMWLLCFSYKWASQCVTFVTSWQVWLPHVTCIIISLLTRSN